MDPKAFFLGGTGISAWPICKNPYSRKAWLSLRRGCISPGCCITRYLGTWAVRSRATQGQRAEAQKVLEQLNELAKPNYVPPMCSARIHVGLGDRDKAFEWLEKSYDDRSIAGVITFVKVDPVFDPLRSDARFADLLRRMNLQP